MKDEIISGLRSGMEHGSSLEQAVKSFINAGYNPQEVHAAAQMISSGASQIVHAPDNDLSPGGEHDLPPMPSVNGTEAPSAPVGNEMVGKKKSSGKTLLVIILIVFLIAVLGGIGWLMYEFLKS